jgi:alanyl-tRNA synthetase
MVILNGFLANRDTAYRVLADHARTLTFAIADGAVPSNEGRGYVLRRILRRAVRYGMQTLGAKPGFFSQIVPIVGKCMGKTFPEVLEKQQNVIAIVKEEEASFSQLLEKGVKYLNELISSGRAVDGVISGEEAFYLYDTLGFPIDLTQIMAAENNLRVDTDGFQAAMTLQKNRSRAAMV